MVAAEQAIDCGRAALSASEQTVNEKWRQPELLLFSFIAAQINYLAVKSEFIFLSSDFYRSIHDGCLVYIRFCLMQMSSSSLSSTLTGGGKQAHATPYFAIWRRDGGAAPTNVAAQKDRWVQRQVEKRGMRVCGERRRRSRRSTTAIAILSLCTFGRIWCKLRRDCRLLR